MHAVKLLALGMGLILLGFVLPLLVAEAHAESPWALPPFPSLPSLPPPAITRGFVPIVEFEAMEQRAVRAEAAAIEVQAGAAQRTLVDLETACRTNPVCAARHASPSRATVP